MNLDKLKESARKYEQGGQWRQAVDVYKKALREFEESGEAVPDPSLYNRVGDLEMRSGDAGAAIRAYEQAADLYTEQGFFNNAIALCGKILRINTSRTSTYLRLAQLNARKNFVGEARRNLVEYMERMEALNHREEAINAVRLFATQFSGNPDIRAMLVELLDTTSERIESTELAKLAKELEAHEPGAPGGGHKPAERGPGPARGPRPSRNSAAGLVFIDVGAPDALDEDTPPVDGFEIEGPGEDATEAWRRDTTEVEGLEIIRVDIDEADADAPFVPDFVDSEPFAPDSDEPIDAMDIDAFPLTGADDLTSITDDDELEVRSLDDDEPLARPYETLEEATHADPSGGDLVFLPVDPEDPITADPAPLVEQDPADLARDRARVLLEIGDRQGGIAALEEALQRYEATGRFDNALHTAEELTQLEPAAIFRYQKRVELAYRSGRREVMIQAYLGLADALLQSGGTDHAKTVYRRVLEHDEANPVARAALANLAPPAPAADAGGSFIDLGSLIMDQPAERDTRIRVDQQAPIEDEDQAFLEALAQFKRGIEENLDAEDFQAHYDLGIAFKEMGLLDEAIAQFQKALRSPEGRLKTSEQLGISFYERGRFAIAEAVLRRAIDSLPGGDEEKIGLIYWLARGVEAQRRHEEAIRCYERVLAVDIRFLDVADRVQKLATEPR